MSWDDLRAEAFGEIGLLPREFYLMERSDYWLLHKGFFNKRLYEQRVLRRAVVTLISPWLKNEPNAYRIMPLPEDDKLQAQISEMQKSRRITVSDKSRAILMKFKEKEKARNGGTTN